MRPSARLYSGMLKLAMHVPPEDPTLPEQTPKERAAGREALMAKLRASVVDTGLQELRKRFTKRALPSAGLHFDEKGNCWIADIVVHTAAKTNMVFEDKLMEFPSDHLIAQIALVT